MKYRVEFTGTALVAQAQYIEADSEQNAIDSAVESINDHKWEIIGLTDVDTENGITVSEDE